MTSRGFAESSSRGSSVPRDQPLSVPVVPSLPIDALSPTQMTMPSAAAPASYSVFPVNQPQASESGIDFFHESKVFSGKSKDRQTYCGTYQL